MSSYNINRQAVPESELIEESQEQGGRLAARSTDGLKTYLYADSYEELFQELNCMGSCPIKRSSPAFPSWMRPASSR
jgi:hypothetical protein